MSDLIADINPKSHAAFCKNFDGALDDDNLGFFWESKEKRAERKAGREAKEGGSKFSFTSLFGGGGLGSKPVLKEGMGTRNGTDEESMHVKDVQERVNTSVDGKFGSGTATAVRRWQKDHGLDDTGIVDDATWSALYGKPPKAERQAKTTQTLTDTFSFLTTGISAFTGGGETDLAPIEDSASEPPPNYLLWIGVPVVLLVLGGGVYFMTRPAKD